MAVSPLVYTEQHVSELSGCCWIQSALVFAFRWSDRRDGSCLPKRAWRGRRLSISAPKIGTKLNCRLPIRNWRVCFWQPNRLVIISSTWSPPHLFPCVCVKPMKIRGFCHLFSCPSSQVGNDCGFRAAEPTLWSLWNVAGFWKMCVCARVCVRMSSWISQQLVMTFFSPVMFVFLLRSCSRLEWPSRRTNKPFWKRSNQLFCLCFTTSERFQTF